MGSDTKDIGKKITKGAFWTVGIRMGIRMLGFISTIILARILLPEDFGIVAKAIMIREILELMLAFGFDAALIKNQSARREHYDTVWTLQILRGLFIATVMVLAAYPAADFLNETRLVEVIYVFAGVSLLNGFINVGVVNFRKEMEFDKEFRFVLLRRGMGFVTMVTTAVIWQSYWALVLGTVAGSIVAVSSSYLMSSYRPRLSLEEIKSLFHFSKWMMVHSIFIALALRLDIFLLSRLATSGLVGIYTVAKQVALTPTTEIAMPVASAITPGLSKVNHDPARFQTLYLSTLSIVLLIAIPAGLGVSAVATDLIRVLLGVNWMEAAPLVEVIALMGMAAVMTSNSVSAFIAGDRVSLMARLTLFRFVTRLAGSVIGYHENGAIGLAWGAFAAEMVNLLLVIHSQHRVGMLSIPILLRDNWRTLCAALGMYGCLLTVAPYLPASFGAYPIALLLGKVLAGVMAFFVFLLVLWQASGRPDGPEKTLFNQVRARRTAKAG